eukprot:gene12472-6221_t
MKQAEFLDRVFKATNSISKDLIVKSWSTCAWWSPDLKLKAIKFRGSVPFLAAFCIWIFILRILIAKFSFLKAENDRSLIHG